MKVKITFKAGSEATTYYGSSEHIYKDVTYMTFPKVKTIALNHSNGLATFLFTKCIEKIEVIEK